MINEIKRTKIVCTIGPASGDEKTLSDLMDNGLNVCRLNFSHGTQEEHLEKINLIKKLRRKKDLPVAILLDTKGPEIRTGNFVRKDIRLEQGQNFTITMDDVVGDETKCSISYKELAKDIKPGNKLLIDDGLIELEVQEVAGSDIHCKVINSGIINDRKGVNVPGVKINLPAITDKDKSDIIFGIENDIDFIAVSFVRKPADVMAIREILENNGGENINIISKIENREGIDNIKEILTVSDGIMIARGDLGVEIPAENIPVFQKELIQLSNDVCKPVITATQMLDSMIRNPRPTRAEVTDVANAIFDGTDAVMLSGETAAGKYPVETLKFMVKIAKAAEENIDYDVLLKHKKNKTKPTITTAISHATCTTASDLKAGSIITATSGGYTARMVSSYRPKAPIIATTDNRHTYYSMSLLWGVTPIINTKLGSTDDIIESSIKAALDKKILADGDLVVITAGVPVGKSGTTNLIKVHLVTDNLAKGVGIGKLKISSKARIIYKTDDTFEKGDILIAKSVDTDMADMVGKAAAIVTETGGLTSYAAIVGIELGIPVIVSAAGATQKIKDGQIITVDAETGIVYSGKVKLL